MRFIIRSLAMGFCILVSHASDSLAIRPLPPNPEMLQAAPDECIFFVHSFGFQSPDADSSNQTERLFADPEVQDFISELKNLRDQAIEKLAEDQKSDDEKQRVRKMFGLASELAIRPITGYISRIDVNAAEPDVDAAFLVDTGSEQRASEILSELQTMMAKPDRMQPVTLGGVKCWEIRAPNEPLINLAALKSNLVITVGEGSMEKLIAQAKTDVPKWLKSVESRLQVPAPGVIVYADVQQLNQMIAKTDDEKAKKAWKQLGFADINYLGFVTGLDEVGLVSRGLLASDPLQGLLDVVGKNGVTRDTLRQIPRQTESAFSLHFNLIQAFDWMREFASSMDPNAESELQEGMQQASQELGLDVRSDILEVLGDNWLIYRGSGFAAMMVADMVAAVDVKNEDKANHTLATLVEFLTQQMEQRPGNTIKIVPAKFDQAEGYTVRGLPVGISACVHGGQLVVGLSSSGLRQFLKSDRTDESSIVADQRVAALLDRHAEHIAVSFSDVNMMITQSYPMIQMMLNMGAGQLTEQGMEFDPTKLPRPSVIKQYLAPSVASIRRTEDGIEFEAREVLPQVSLSTGGGPVMVALMLPAVQAARAAARRVASINNLRQIDLALLNFESATRRFPTAGKNGLSWRVYVLPYMEEQALYDQFHLDEPWDSEHNKTLIAKMPQVYKSPVSKAEEGKTVYLAVRGSDPIIADQETGVRVADIRDGTSNTAMLVEVNDDRAVTWTKPDDFDWKADDPAAGLGSMHPGDIFVVAFCDGHTVVIPKSSATKENLAAIFTKAGGEAVDHAALGP